MPQLFSRRANTVAHVSLAAGLLVLAGLVVGAGLVVRSPWATEIGVAVQQPIPFSHQHHVRDDMIDCRYCHTSVEHSAYAGMPATGVCMNCHSQLWSESRRLPGGLRGGQRAQQPDARHRQHRRAHRQQPHDGAGGGAGAPERARA